MRGWTITAFFPEWSDRTSAERRIVHGMEAVDLHGFQRYRARRRATQRSILGKKHVSMPDNLG